MREENFRFHDILFHPKQNNPLPPKSKQKIKINKKERKKDDVEENVRLLCVRRKMNSSNLICDCQLAWLPRWLRDAGLDVTVTLRCAHPRFLANHSIFDVQRDEFECGQYLMSDSQLRKITNVKELSGRNALLHRFRLRVTRTVQIFITPCDFHSAEKMAEVNLVETRRGAQGGLGGQKIGAPAMHCKVFNWYATDLHKSAETAIVVQHSFLALQRISRSRLSSRTRRTSSFCAAPT